MTASTFVAADYTIIMPSTLKVTGNQVVCRIIRSSSCALCGLPSVKKRNDVQVNIYCRDNFSFSFNVSVTVIGSPRLRLITLNPTLIILDSRIAHHPRALHYQRFSVLMRPQDQGPPRHRNPFLDNVGREYIAQFEDGCHVSFGVGSLNWSRVLTEEVTEVK